MTNRSKIPPLVAGALRILLAGVFGWAGVAKLISPQAFAEGVAAFQIFPNATINVIAMTVPVIELVAAALLVTPWWYRLGSLISATLSACFIALFIWVGVYGISVNCSCFGTFGSVTSAPAGALRGVVLLALSAALYLYAFPRQRGTEP